MRAVIQRIHAISWRRRWMLIEASTLLAAAFLAIRLLPFRRIVGLAADLPFARKTRAEDEALLVEDVQWAIGQASRRVPWRAVCFDIGLALHLMLGRRGIASILHYGVRQSEEKGLEAHVWVSLKGKTIVGGETAGTFACLETFPSQD